MGRDERCTREPNFPKPDTTIKELAWKNKLTTSKVIELDLVGLSLVGNCVYMVHMHSSKFVSN